MRSNFIDKAISTLPPDMIGRALKITPRVFFDRKKDLLFRQVIKYVSRNSPFYRRKFKEFGIKSDKVRYPSDLGDFYTTPDDIVSNAEEFICGKPHTVFESSGTTGRNKRIYLTQGELDSIGKFNAAGLFLGGVTDTDRIVNAFDFCIWIPGIIAQKSIEKSGFFGINAGKVDPMEVYRRIPQYDLNIIMGEPTWLIKLTEIAEKNGSYPLKYIIGGAEELPEAARPWMKDVWQGAEVKMLYGTVESAGIIGFEPYPECGSYHIDENSFFVEIADPDNDGYGEVTFTTLRREAMPLVRYRNRDISRIIDEQCRCGLPFRKLAKIRGRSDELIVASGGNLYPLMFEEILRDVKGITNDWQIVFSLRGIKEIMEFNLELSDNNVSKQDIEKKIFFNIQSKYPDLHKNASLGIFDMVFTYHTPDSLRAANRKLLRTVDRRYQK
ncbi:MAG: hypothetical protein ABH883_09740 [Candidatus Omnitrophota bacterium]